MYYIKMVYNSNLLWQSLENFSKEAELVVLWTIVRIVVFSTFQILIFEFNYTL